MGLQQYVPVNTLAKDLAFEVQSNWNMMEWRSGDAASF